METITTEIIPLQRRIFISRVVFSFIFLTLLYAAVSNTLMHQLQSPPLRYPYVDPAYWAMHLLRIPDRLVSNYVAALSFDLLLFLCCIACILFPLKRNLFIVFLGLYFIYFITYNSYGGHHTHSLIGVLLIIIPFLFIDTINFTLMWQALRYYTLFIFVSAFLWKVCRLTFLNKDHGILIMKNNLTSYIYYHPDSVLSNIYHWLFQHSSFTNGIYIVGVILEGIFIIGFFTKKYDMYLLLISVLLITGFWFMADAFFFQLLVLCFTLVNFTHKRSRSYL